MHIHMHWLHTVNYGTCNLLCTSVVVQLCNCSTTPLLCPFCPILYLCQFWRLWWASSLRQRYWFSLHRQIKSLLIVLVLRLRHNMPIDLANTLIQKKHYLCINGCGLKKFLVFCIRLVPFFHIFLARTPWVLLGSLEPFGSPLPHNPLLCSPSICGWRNTPLQRKSQICIWNMLCFFLCTL